MIVIAIFVAIAVLLFAAAFIANRRFGLLGLALAAGSIISGIWNYDAGLVVSSTGLVPSGPLTDAIVLSLLVLLPAAVLLFHGYSYKTLFGRAIGAALFTLLALAFLVEPIGHVLVLEGPSAQAYQWLVVHKEVIISLGMVFAVIDLFFTKPAHLAEKSRKR
jgi:hypothetical protein